MMEVTLLVFLFLLISAGTTRKLISRDVALSGDYLEEEKEDTDDDEKTINVKQSPEISARTLLSRFGGGEDLLRKSIQSLQEKSKFITRGEDESFQEEQELESRLGPHYLTRQNHGEEPPSDGMVEDSAKVSDTADLLRKNTDQESYKEDAKVKVMLVVSCTTLICSFMFMLCCFIVLIKYRMKKGNFCDKFRRSQEKQKQSVPFLEHVKSSPDASVSRAAQNGPWDENGKTTKSETPPGTNTVVFIPQISSVLSLPRSFSDENLNRDQN